jgi:MoxR-like ATPase
MISALVWLLLSCVIPYGEPVSTTHHVSDMGPDAQAFAVMDARLLAELEDEDDRDKLERLVLARELLAHGKMLRPEARQEILDYIGALLEIEGRAPEQSLAIEPSELQPMIQDEELEQGPLSLPPGSG